MDRVTNEEIRRRMGVTKEVLNYIQEEIDVVWSCENSG